MQHSIHRCLRWHLWSSFVTGHNGQELPATVLSHMLTDTQWKWSTTEQEAYCIYYAVTKRNYYLQGSDIVVCNDHKPLQRSLNGINANNKVNGWPLELSTHNITFEWKWGARKAADCLSWLVDVKDTPVTSTVPLTCWLHPLQMVLSPTPAARQAPLQIPHNIWMLKSCQILTKWMHLQLSWKSHGHSLINAEDRSLLQMHF